MKLQTINLLSKFSDTKGLTIINKPHWKLKRHTWNKQLSLNSYLRILINFLMTERRNKDKGLTRLLLQIQNGLYLRHDRLTLCEIIDSSIKYDIDISCLPETNTN